MRGEHRGYGVANTGTVPCVRGVGRNPMGYYELILK